MNYESLYNQAMSGNVDAHDMSKEWAGSGNAQAQFIISCVYDNLDSSYFDVKHSIYWLKKSADYNYEPTIKMYEFHRITRH